jgi:hypothetical protein
MRLFSNDRATGELKAWASEHAIRLDLPILSERNFERLGSLDAAIGGKRIVYLGEPDHFVHEKYDYRLLMLRYLVSRGWKHIGEEMGVVDGHRIYQFVASGDSDFLDRVPMYGYKGGQRTDRDDSATGLLKDSFTAFPLAPFVAEQRSFGRGLRDIASGLNFFGFDITLCLGRVTKNSLGCSRQLLTTRP